MNIFDEYILFLIVERKSKTTWNVINYNIKKIYNIIDTRINESSIEFELEKTNILCALTRLKLLAQRLVANIILNILLMIERIEIRTKMVYLIRP